MTIKLTLTYKSTTIDLMTAGYMVRDGFYPETATDMDKQVADRLDVIVIGSSLADLDSKIRAIELAFEQARRHTTGPDGCYIHYAIDTAMDAWRSRVTNGLVMHDGDLSRRAREFKAVLGLVVERAPYWEGPEVQLALSNPLGSGNTSGLKIYNPRIHYTNLTGTVSFDATTQRINDAANGLADFLDGMTIRVEGSTSNDGPYTVTDGGNAGYIGVAGSAIVNETAGATIGIDGAVANYVEIAAADVIGNLAGAARLEITNTYNSINRVDTIWIGQNVESEPATFSHILEAEDAAGETTIDSINSSGNKNKECAWSDAAETNLLTWTLSTAELNKLAGHYVRVIGRFGSISGLWLRLKVKFALTTLWEGPLTLMGTTQLQEITSLRLPPYLLGAGDLYPLDLILSAKVTTAGAHSFTLDYLQLTTLDGWRKLAPKGYGLDYMIRIVDDGIDSYLYTDGWIPGGKTGHYVGYGEPILLQPGKLQRLYFLHEETTGSAPTNRTMSVKVYYRPRRLTI